MVMFMHSFFQVPKGVLEKVEYFRSIFFWQNDEHKKVHISQMGHTLPTKRPGRMGIMNIDIQNQCLLSKWWYKLMNEQGIWQDLLRRKYMQDKAIGQIRRKPEDSQLWSGIMSVKDLFLGFGTFHLNSGTNIRFREDIWVENRPLNDQFAHLYRIVRHKHDTATIVFSTVPLNISFRRYLRGDTLQTWYELVAKVANVRLNDREDKFRWGHTENGIFKVRSMYYTIIVRNIWENRLLWKLKLPLKIKIFLWY
jgi:hypothetical protein